MAMNDVTNWQVITGDCLDVMRGMNANSVDTIITDPPAGISFMGKEWDSHKGGRSQWVAWLTEVMAEGLRVLKPGGMALVWALPRTSHWTALAVEDAGFEIREKIYHLFGSGFPKSANISKMIDKAAGAEREVIGERPYSLPDIRGNSSNGRGISGPMNDGKERLNGTLTAPATPAAQEWDGWGTALKPAAEEWIVAMKPLDGTFAANALEWGVAGLWIDGGRVPTSDNLNGGTYSDGASNGTVYGGGLVKPAGRPYVAPSGRWPSNLIHDGSAEVLAGFPVTTSASRNPETCIPNGRGMFAGGSYEGNTYSDTGSAARFFYCAKASRAERNAGLEEGATNGHPTVKSLNLMRYLCRLTKTPTGGVVLDPFAGSGSTGCAAVMEGRSFIGIELSDEYAEIARARIAHAKKQVPVAEQGSLL